MLCRFEKSTPPAASASAPAEAAQAAAGSAQNASDSAEANRSSADANREQAVKDLTSLIFGQASEAKAEPAVPEQRFDDPSLVGLAMPSKLWENWALVARVIPSLPALSLC